MKTNRLGWLLCWGVLVLGPAPAAHASFAGGLGRVASGLLALPVGILGGTLNGPPVIGSVTGALAGAFQAVSQVGGGTLELLGSAVPVLKSLAPLVPFAL